jgi:isopenicillin-N epimerase
MADFDFASLWTLDPQIDFLNHGSYGACPRAVLDLQAELRARMEREPLLFLSRQLEGLLDEARGALAQFVGADADDLAFVTNATTGVNTVLRSLPLRPGDQLLTTDHAYNACLNALHAQEARGAEVVVANVPWPIEGPAQVTEALLRAGTERTRLVLLDHVTSSSGLVFPVAEIVARFAERGIDTLVDGAHAPGMLPLDLRALGAAYYTGNCHKWVCAPKGSAFLHVRRDKQAGVRPLVISHGANADRPERSLFRREFDWTGTHDPTAFLCVPAAIRFLESLLPGGIAELRERNHSLALQGRALICEALRTPPPAPASMLGSLASVPVSCPDPKALLKKLFDDHGSEVSLMPFPSAARPLIRVTAQIYNSPPQYARLAQALRTELHL